MTAAVRWGVLWSKFMMPAGGEGLKCIAESRRKVTLPEKALDGPQHRRPQGLDGMLLRTYLTLGQHNMR